MFVRGRGAEVTFIGVGSVNTTENSTAALLTNHRESKRARLALRSQNRSRACTGLPSPSSVESDGRMGRSLSVGRTPAKPHTHTRARPVVPSHAEKCSVVIRLPLILPAPHLLSPWHGSTHFRRISSIASGLIRSHNQRCPPKHTYCCDATSASFTFMPATCLHSAQGLKQNTG